MKVKEKILQIFHLFKDNKIKKVKEHEYISLHKRNFSEGEALKNNHNGSFMKLKGDEITNSHNDKLIMASALSKRIYSDHHEVKNQLLLIKFVLQRGEAKAAI